MEEQSLRLSFSEDLSEDELARDWSLTVEDLTEIRQSRGNFQRLHFAVQLCCLKRFGKFLNPFKVPIKIVNHIYLQLEISPVLFMPDASFREKTYQEHEAKIRVYCGFESFSERHFLPLQEHLIGLANEGVDRDALFQKAHLYLFDRRITPPGQTVLIRVVHSAYSRAEKGIFDDVLERIPVSMRKKIDSILEVDEDSGISALIRYREYPKVPRPDYILEYLDRYQELLDMGAVDLDLSGIKTEIIIQFYSLTCAYSAFRLRRFDEKKRYSLVGCFLSEASKIILDYIVEMNDQYLISMCRKARNSFELEYREARRKSKIGRDIIIAAMHDLLTTETRTLTIVHRCMSPGF
jgi:hypothetical protein